MSYLSDTLAKNSSDKNHYINFPLCHLQIYGVFSMLLSNAKTKI